MSISDAASDLSLSAARVRLLASSGDLSAEKIGGRWLVERSAVERRRRQGASGGRRFIPANAWAMLGLASGEEAVGIDPGARSRFRRLLASDGLEVLAPRLEHRAKVIRYRAHPGEIAHLRKDPGIVASGVSAARDVGLDLTAGREVDGYVSAAALDEIVKKHALSPASVEANVILRVVPDEVWAVSLDGRSHAHEAAVALDLGEDPDPRSQAAGRELLARLERKEH